MNFNDIIGQQAVVRSLQNSIINNMISHAYVFEGPEGIGKKTIAGIYANALLCENNQPEPCCVCRSCLKYKSSNHPDIKIISITDNSSIGVDVIRELKRDIYIKPYESRKKIYVIHSADRMTTQAQNSLLKILEEPPGYAIIILITANASLLLPTIMSRAVLVRFSVHPYGEVEHFLKKNYNGINEQIPFISAFSGGIIGRAKEIAESEQFRDARENVIKIIMDLLDNNEKKILDAVTYFNENKQYINIVLEFMLLWFRDILFMKELQNKSMVINIDIEKKLLTFSQKISRHAVVRIIDIILETKKKINMNANYNLAVEMMLIQSWEEVHGRSSRSAV